MAASLTQNSNDDDGSTSEGSDLNVEQWKNVPIKLAARSKPGSRAIKRESLWNPKLVRTMKKHNLLTKITNSSGKPYSSKKNRVEKLNSGNKKQKSPRSGEIRISPTKTVKRKQPEAMSDEDLPTAIDNGKKKELFDLQNHEVDLPLQCYEENLTPRAEIDLEDIPQLWSEDEDSVSTSEDSDDLTIRIHSEGPRTEISGMGGMREFLVLEPLTQLDKSFTWLEYNSTQFAKKGDSPSQRSLASDNYEETPGFKSQETSTDDLYIIRKVSVVPKKVRASNPVDRDREVYRTASVSPRIAEDPEVQYGPEDPEVQYGAEDPEVQYGPEDPEVQYGPEDPEVQYGPEFTEDQLKGEEEFKECLDNLPRYNENAADAFREYQESRRPIEFYAIRPCQKSSYIQIGLFILILVICGISCAGLYLKYAQPEPIPEPTMMMTMKTTVAGLWQYFLKLAPILYFYN